MAPVPRTGANEEPSQSCCGHSGFIPGEKTNRRQSAAPAAIVPTLDMCA